MIDQISDQGREAILRELRKTPTPVLTTLANEFPKPLDAYGAEIVRELKSRRTTGFTRFRFSESGSQIGDAFGWALTNCAGEYGFWIDRDLQGYGALVGYVELYDEIDVTLFAIQFPESVRRS